MFTRLLILFALYLTSLPIQAVTVSLDYKKGVTLLADLEGADENALPERMVLLHHGSMAHKDMEIIEYTQELLADESIASLAITLSLDMDKREGFYSCDRPHTHRHEDSIAELDAWISWLGDKGVKEIILAGHSRGGNQVARYQLHEKNPLVKGVVMIAAMTFKTPDNAHFREHHGMTYDDMLKMANSMEDEEIIDQSMPFLHCQETRISAGTFKSYYMLEEQNTPDILSRVPVPMILFLGSDDKLTTDMMPQIEKKDIPYLQVHIVEGADHFFRDLYGDEMVEVMIEFMESL